MNRKSKRGITLVELIVALTLTSIFAVLCVALINPIERTYRGTLKLARAQLLADTLVDSIRKECDDVKHDEKMSVWIGNLDSQDDSDLIDKGPAIKGSSGNVLVFQRNNNYTEAIYSCAKLSEKNISVYKNTESDHAVNALIIYKGDEKTEANIDYEAMAANTQKGIVHFGYYKAKEDDRGVFPINSYDYTNPVLASTYGEFTVDLSFSELTMSKSGKYPIYVICTVKVLDKGSVFYTRSAVLCFSANGSGNGNGGSYKPVTDKNISVTIRWLNINDEVVAWPSSVPSVSVVLTDDGIVKGQYNAIRDQRKFVFASVKVKGNVAVTSEDVTGYEYVVTGNADKGFVITYKIAKNDTVKLVSGKTFLNIMG
ncbi:MAG: type II secretion system GspH family protein, partial [Saccharofermentans sp.]|nr:type II secretion system GspH family protein [Saccharofermentans sp.]